MGINVSRFQDRTRTVVFEYEGESASVTFKPQKFELLQIQAAKDPKFKNADDFDAYEEWIRQIAETVTEWDFVVETPDGDIPLPITCEAMDEFLPPTLIMMLLKKLSSEVVELPKDKQRKSSRR